MELQESMDQLKQYAPEVITQVSFEKYNLGPKGTLVTNNLTDIFPFLKQLGVKTFPMISSYPYPPQFIEYMRYVFSNPDDFISTVIEETNKYGFTGVNVDWEPTTGATAQDAVAYAHFLSRFAGKMHEAGKMLTVDVGSWSPIWNWTLLGDSGIDRVLLMSTYTGDWRIWKEDFNRAINQIGLDHLGVGLETINPNTKKNLTHAELEERFAMILPNNIQQIDIWKMPLPLNWFPFLKKYRTSA